MLINGESIFRDILNKIENESKAKVFDLSVSGKKLIMITGVPYEYILPLVIISDNHIVMKDEYIFKTTNMSYTGIYITKCIEMVSADYSEEEVYLELSYKDRIDLIKAEDDKEIVSKLTNHNLTLDEYRQHEDAIHRYADIIIEEGNVRLKEREE